MLFVDIFIALLQVVILGIILERAGLKSAIESGQVAASNVSTNDPTLSVLPTRQDIDAEEQGIRRSQENFADDIEMSTLKGNGGGHEDLESQRRRHEHALDGFYSGQVVIADVHFSDTIRTAWRRRYGV